MYIFYKIWAATSQSYWHPINMLISRFSVCAMLTYFIAGVTASTTGVYNTSKTPSNLPWNTYNYCNSPHVNVEHYSKPDNVTGAKLVYLNVVMRHHKVRACCYFSVRLLT